MIAAVPGQSDLLLVHAHAQVNVQFDTFYIFNLIPIKAPPSAAGSLRVTYVKTPIARALCMK